MEKENTVTVVAVGGTNSLKVGGTAAAFERLPEASTDYLVRGTKGNSIVNEQPIGIDETRRGAEHRATLALAVDTDAVYGIGIENGLIPEGGSLFDKALFELLMRARWFPAQFGWGKRWLRRWLERFSFYDLAYVCVASHGRRTYATSAGVPCPLWAAIESIITRQQRTAGNFIGEKMGWNAADWHKELAGGLSGRGSLLYEAVFLAVALHLTGRCT